MSVYDELQRNLQNRPKTWLVTGAAGFIGSHLVEKLLNLGQDVIGFDNLSTGKSENLIKVRSHVGPEGRRRFRFIKGDIRKLQACLRACESVDYVLHQAAVGSVPRSVEDPIRTNESNVTGFLNMLVAARDNGVSRFVFASSSSVYGDEEHLPKVEARIGKPLSPYAVSKRVNELYAEVFSGCYRFQTIGLRYFNVFGPRQNPAGPYAAVIPKWIDTLREGRRVTIYGDGETTRDFCYVDNVVQANLLAACSANDLAVGGVFNIACNERTSLNDLFAFIREGLLPKHPSVRRMKPIYKPFRPGDVRHSQAAIDQAVRILGYSPQISFEEGIRKMLFAVNSIA